MPQFVEPVDSPFDPIDPPWLEDHFADDDSHVCDSCQYWAEQRSDLVFPDGAIRPNSGKGAILGIEPYNSFTAISNLWCTTDFFRNRGYFDQSGVGITESTVQYAIAYASDILYRMSARQYPGLNERIVYPGSSRKPVPLGVAYFDSVYQRDTYEQNSYVPIVDCNDTCVVGMDHVIRLPGPISNIIEIVIDGEVLDPSNYRIRGHREVVRLDAPWPKYNDLTHSPYDKRHGENIIVSDSAIKCNCADSKNWVDAWAADAGHTTASSICSTCEGVIGAEIDPHAATTHRWANDPTYESVLASLNKSVKTCSSWVIRYYQGKCPPISGQLACAALAKEIIGWLEDSGCFPKNMRRLTADGIDARFSDRFQAIGGKDLFGIPEVDIFLMAVNPNSLARRGYVRRGDQRHKKVLSLRSPIPEPKVSAPAAPIVPVVIRKDLRVYQGDTMTLAIVYKTATDGDTSQPVSLEGSTVIGQIRESLTATTVVATFNCYLDNQITNPGRIVADLSPAESAKLVKPNYVYDIELTFPDGDKQTLLHGKIQVMNDVSEGP